MIGLRAARSFLRRAICEIREDNRYRYYPLYSAALAGLVYMWYIWPWDDCVYEVFRDIDGMWLFNSYSVDAVCVTTVCCGTIGLFRRGVAPKVLSCIGLYGAVWWWEPFNFMNGLPSDVLYYVFDVPERYISGFAGIETGGATLIWFGYLAIVYVLVRPLLKRGYRYVRALESRILDRLPAGERFAKPLL